jgi:hypothetical protein
MLKKILGFIYLSSKYSPLFFYRIHIVYECYNIFLNLFGFFPTFGIERHQNGIES